MQKYEIEYAQFTKVIVEAESRSDAEEIAAIMDGEEISRNDPHEYNIWDIRQVD